MNAYSGKKVWRDEREQREPGLVSFRFQLCYSIPCADYTYTDDRIIIIWKYLCRRNNFVIFEQTHHLKVCVCVHVEFSFSSARRCIHYWWIIILQRLRLQLTKNSPASQPASGVYVCKSVRLSLVPLIIIFSLLYGWNMNAFDETRGKLSPRRTKLLLGLVFSGI